MGNGVFLCFLFIFLNGVNGEFSSAQSRMAELHQTKVVLVSVLEEYISSTEHRLQQLKMRVDAYSKEIEEASADLSSYLSNPINTYLLVNRLSTDWKESELLMYDYPYEVYQKMISYRHKLKFPTDNDLSVVEVDFMNRNDKYKLDSSSVDKEKVKGLQASVTISADKCFEIGKMAFDNEDFYYTFFWMSRALLKYEREVYETVVKWEILEHLSYSFYVLGNVRRALVMIDEVLDIFPEDDEVLNEKRFYQALIADENSKSVTQEVENSSIEDLKEPRTYEKMCQSNESLSPALIADLKCRYVHKDIPFLRIAPLKEEEAFLDPKILLYREVMSDREIEVIKNLAKPKLFRALTDTVENDGVSSYRIAKAAWLKSEEDEVVATINQRIEDLTSLTLQFAEDLHVINYHVGGLYKPHHDFLESYDEGNRIATVIFYMNNVLQGGATVFPDINLTIQPEKGSAVFWHNLYHNGEPDFDTLHAACPILAGSKWVSTKWIHAWGQEFRRPCKLRYYDKGE